MNVAAELWSRQALVDQVLHRRRDGRAELALHVPQLAAPASALYLEQQLRALAGVAHVRFDIAAERARLTFDDAVLPLSRVLAACAAAGCPAEPLRRERVADVDGRLLRASLTRLAVAGLFAMQAMMFALVLYVGAIDHLDATTVQVFRWLGMLAAIPVIGYAAWPFYRDALDGLRARRVGIDIPVALAIVAIFGASALNAVRGTGEVYFDSISMFVFVLLLGRHLQLRAHRQHRSLGERAADATPMLAVKLEADGTRATVAALELEPGDRVWVAAGAAVPCDGVLDDAAARIDTAILTGEARATSCWHGDAIAAGSIALDAPCVVRVTRAAADSTASVLERLAAHAQGARGLAGEVDIAAARRFVWRVLALAFATATFWLLRDPARAFDATVAVLVVACPCAFGLAAPAALTRAMAVLARRGVLVLRPASLGALARADRVVFDKTGTLTEPASPDAATTTVRGVADTEVLRPHARATVAALRAAGLAPALLSGDVAMRVQAAAAALGIEDWSARQASADKLARVRREQAAGHVVLAVGDGSNDAAALAAADVSAVPTNGTALARRHADIVLPDGIEALPIARALAARARAIVRQNRHWSLAWNLGAVPFAALGFVPPWLAMLGMAASSLSVVLNTLRVRTPRAPSGPPLRLRERTA